MNNSIAKYVILILAVGVLLPALAIASTITTANGVGADTHITRSDPNSNFGSEDHFSIKNDSGTGDVDRKGYIRFDVGCLSNAISSATLSLTFVTAAAGSANTNTFNVFGLSNEDGDLWSESDINWSNAPANNQSSGTGFTSDAVFLGTFTITLSQLGDSIPFTSPQLIEFLNNDTNGLVTLMLSRQSPASLHNQAFASKENLSFEAPSLTLIECPADITGDDLVNVSDLLILLGSWGIDFGDITCDGTTNVTDLLALLGAWGLCP